MKKLSKNCFVNVQFSKWTWLFLRKLAHEDKNQAIQEYLKDRRNNRAFLVKHYKSDIIHEVFFMEGDKKTQANLGKHSTIQENNETMIKNRQKEKVPRNKQKSNKCNK